MDPAGDASVDPTLYTLSGGITNNDWVEVELGGGGGLWVESNNDIYNSNSGNVGIGTSTPEAKLHVVGGAKISDSLTITGSSGEVKVDDGILRIYDNDKSHNLYFEGGNNIAYVKSNALGSLMTFSLASNVIQFNQPVGMGMNPISYDRLAIKASSTSDIANIIKSQTPTDDPALYVKGSGKVGIGTDLPEESLQVTPSLLVGKKGFITPVAGRLRVASPNASYGELGFTSQYDNFPSGIRSYGLNSNYDRDLRFYTKNNVSADDGLERMRITYDGNGGIGTI